MKEYQDPNKHTYTCNRYVLCETEQTNGYCYCGMTESWCQTKGKPLKFLTLHSPFGLLSEKKKMNGDPEYIKCASRDGSFKPEESEI